jgi:hypothetical protein
MCPSKVKIPFQRMHQRVLTKSVHKETTSQVQAVDYAQFSVEISEDTQDAVDIASTFPVGYGDDEDTLLEFRFDKCLNYDWSTPTIQVPLKTSNWLEDTLKEHEKSTVLVEENELGLPLCFDCTFYELD